MKAAILGVPQKEKNVGSNDKLEASRNGINEAPSMREKQETEKEKQENLTKEGIAEEGKPLKHPVRRMTDEEEAERIGGQNSLMEDSEPFSESQENLRSVVHRKIEGEKTRNLDEQTGSVEGVETPVGQSGTLINPLRHFTEEEKAERIGGQARPIEEQFTSLEGVKFLDRIMNLGVQNGGTQAQTASKCTFTRPPNAGSLDTDGITFYEEGGNTYAQERKKSYKLFDGTMRITSGEEVLQEVYDKDGSVKAMKRDYRYEVCLTLMGQNMCEIVGLDSLYTGDFIKAMSGGRSILQPETHKKYYKIFIKKNLQAKNYPRVIVYVKGGWKRFLDGTYGYVTPNGVIGYPNLPIKVASSDCFGIPNQSFDGNVCIAKKFLWMRAVLPGSQSFIVMQYYLMVGLLRGILKAFGIEPDFSLMVRGPSNVGKSTIAVLLYKIMNRHILTNDDADFTATIKALDEFKSNDPDTVFVIDDITPKSKNEAGKKLEFLLRQYGNSHARSVSQAYAKKQGEQAYFPALNQMAVTAEVMPQLCLSARSRMVDVEIKAGECHFGAVSREQQQAWMLPQFCYNFLKFVTAKQRELFPYYADKFKKLRDLDLLQCRMKRYNSTFAVFMIVADIFKQFLLASGELAQCKVDKIVDEDLKAIKAVILENDKECCKLSDMENVSDEFDEMIAEAVISEIKKQSTGAGREIVITHKNFFVVRPKDLLEMVNSYIHKEGVSTTFTSGKLGERLQDGGLIKTAREGGKVRRTLKFSLGDNKYERCYFFYREKVNALVTSVV